MSALPDSLPFPAAPPAAPDERAVKQFMNDAYDGNYWAVKAFLRKYGPEHADVTKGEPAEWTALMWAAKSGKKNVVEALLDGGAELDRHDRADNSTALMWAARMGNTDVVEFLLSRGADPAVRDRDGCSAAEHAVRNGHEKLGERLAAEVAAREQKRVDEEQRRVRGIEMAAQEFRDGMRETVKTHRLRLIPGKKQGGSAP